MDDTIEDAWKDILLNGMAILERDETIGKEVDKAISAGKVINTEEGANFLEKFVFKDSVSTRMDS
jgi:hypothetical protein